MANAKSYPMNADFNELVLNLVLIVPTLTESILNNCTFNLPYSSRYCALLPYTGFSVAFLLFSMEKIRETATLLIDSMNRLLSCSLVLAIDSVDLRTSP